MNHNHKLGGSLKSQSGSLVGQNSSSSSAHDCKVTSEYPLPVEFEAKPSGRYLNGLVQIEN